MRSVTGGCHGPAGHGRMMGPCGSSRRLGEWATSASCGRATSASCAAWQRVWTTGGSSTSRPGWSSSAPPTSSPRASPTTSRAAPTRPEYGLVAVDDTLPERDRYLIAMSSAVQLSGLAERIGMAQSTQVVQTKMLDYFFSLRKLHRIAFQPIVELATGRLYEYECLFRPDMPMLPQSIGSVVQAAIDTDRGVELDVYIVATDPRAGRPPRGRRPESRHRAAPLRDQPDALQPARSRVRRRGAGRPGPQRRARAPPDHSFSGKSNTYTRYTVTKRLSASPTTLSTPVVGYPARVGLPETRLCGLRRSRPRDPAR